jgi:N,N'-diacetylchitobiose phosphorylase
MRYGYFDDSKREYVFERPDTPRPWINYLGVDEYCAIITQNGGGYSFYQSPGNNRVLRHRFNTSMGEGPGRYLYMRDEADGDVWSVAWMPVQKPLDKQKVVSRHGLGYTTIESTYRDIETSVTYYVPRNVPYEVWAFKAKNTGKEARTLTLTTYSEFAFFQTQQDFINFQYSLFIMRKQMVDGIADIHAMGGGGNWWHRFLAATENPVDFDLDRETFIGPWRDESNPIAMETGKMARTTGGGGNAIAALKFALNLKPGEEREIVFALGDGQADKVGREARERYRIKGTVQKELAELESYYTRVTGCMAAKTPDPAFDTMANVWHAHQAHVTFQWSRSASFIEAGGRTGYGFRDSLQDCLGMAAAHPDRVRKLLCTVIEGQAQNGSAWHHIDPTQFKPGSGAPPEHEIFSDDHLWIILAVCHYIRETGDFAFLDHKVAFADAGEGTVFEHMRKALDFAFSKRGPNGLCLGLRADWNDCINLRGKGESVWTSMLLCRTLHDYEEVAGRTKRASEAEWALAEGDKMRKTIVDKAWTGDWFIRAYLDSGGRMGAPESRGAKIFINTQSWALISGVADKAQASKVIESMNKYLKTPYGLVLCDPAYGEYINEMGAITTFPKGYKENAAIFCHTNPWAVIAAAMNGQGNLAMEYYKSFAPNTLNENGIDLRKAEPYVLTQFVVGKDQHNHGEANNPWLTGTASWTYIAITQYILGIRPEMDGLRISPCIPSAWDGFTAQRMFRGTNYDITVENPNHVESGVTKITVDGKEICPQSPIPLPTQSGGCVKVVVTIG